MTTEERVERLERELAGSKRRTRWLMAAAALVAVGLTWAGNRIPGIAQAQEGGTGAKVVRANEFILEDESGKKRADLTVLKDGPALRLLDEKGKERARLTVLKNGPGLVLYDESGMPRALLTVFEKGPGLTLWGEKLEGSVMLNVSKDGPGLTLLDEKRKLFWQAPR